MNAAIECRVDGTRIFRVACRLGRHAEQIFAEFLAFYKIPVCFARQA